MSTSITPSREVAGASALPPVLPDYDLVRLINRGRCRVVYVAQNIRHGGFCALKVIDRIRSEVEDDLLGFRPGPE